jgi:hypothetical protein
MSQSNIICPGNEWTVLRTDVTRWDRDQNADVVLTGATLTWRIAASATGTAIHDDLSGNMDESPVIDGQYDANVPGTVSLANLSGYDGRDVYEIVEAANGSYRDVKVLRVSMERRV